MCLSFRLIQFALESPPQVTCFNDTNRTYIATVA